MPEFLPGASWIALGGLIAALGPVLIHLLNRRRFKVVHWAAMDFLLQAVQRNRKILELRDLLLLLLRTVCILLLGLGLAGPYFSCSSSGTNPNDPVHAVVLIDNGLSMGYETGGRTLLDDAKSRARTLIESLPSRSLATVVPLCGSIKEYGIEPLATLEDAKSAIDKIELVDRTCSMTQMRDTALEAVKKAPDVPAKRVILFSDQQEAKWPKGSLSDEFQKLPDVQVVSIQRASTDQLENSWIADFRVADGFAVPNAPATFIASIRHQGPPRTHVEVTLTVTLPNGETPSQNQVIDLEENSEGREIRFSQLLPVTPKEGQPLFVGAKISLPEDHLAADNARYLSVPVLNKIPVVFVDQYGKDENLTHNRIGETEPMRRMLSPPARKSNAPSLFSIKHLKLNELKRDDLHDARLVVLAGLSNPGETVPELVEYVRQGGQLLLAAGGDFDWTAWNEAAWREGAGILPTKLQAPIGHTPEEAPGEVMPFFLDYSSLDRRFIETDDNSEEELRNFYQERYFFKAIGADVSDAALDAVADAEKRLLATAETAADKNTLPATNGTKPANKSHNNLAWTRPTVLGTFSNRLPFAIERRMGLGRVLFLTTGIASHWNDLKSDDGKLMFVLLLWPMLKETLPQRTSDTAGELKLPISAADRSSRMEVWRPFDKTATPLGVEAGDDNQSQVVVRQITQRGIYRIQAYHDDAEVPSGRATEAAPPAWEVPWAANGPAEASELHPLTAETFQQKMGDTKWRWVGPNDSITLEGTAIWGQHLWWMLVLAVLSLLGVEMLMLAWPKLREVQPA